MGNGNLVLTQIQENTLSLWPLAARRLGAISLKQEENINSYLIGGFE